MSRSEFLRALESQLEMTDHTLTDDRVLEEVEGWDSMANVLFIALADEKAGVTISGNQIANARTVGQLLSLLGDRLTA